MPDGAPDPLAALRRDPAATGIFTDFDGTLSPIVTDPAAASPVPGAADVLSSLADVYAVVAVVSGRPVSFLAPHVPPRVLAVGLYGLEVLRDGKVRVDPEAEAWRPAVEAAAERCSTSAPAGVVVEPKGLSLTVHYRQAPEREAEVRALADSVAAATGLVARPAKRSVELHPPIEADKGTAIRGLAAGLAAACYLGDDLGDLAAFRALDELAAEGVATVKVAVVGAEGPPELAAAADLRVAGPPAAADLLRSLLPGS